MFDEILAKARARRDFPALEMAAIMNSRAFIDADEGRHDRALEGFREALGAIRGSLPSDDYRIGRSLYNIASAEEKLGRIDDAFAHAGDALSIMRRRKGSDAATVQQVEDLLRRLTEARGAQR